MKLKYQTTTWQKLTMDGEWGVAMFVVAPALQYLTWLWFDPGLFKTIVITLEGMTFLIGFVLLLIGRTYHTQVEE